MRFLQEENQRHLGSSSGSKSSEACTSCREAMRPCAGNITASCGSPLLLDLPPRSPPHSFNLCLWAESFYAWTSSSTLLLDISIGYQALDPNLTFLTRTNPNDPPYFPKWTPKALEIRLEMIRIQFSGLTTALVSVKDLKHSGTE